MCTHQRPQKGTHVCTNMHIVTALLSFLGEHPFTQAELEEREPGCLCLLILTPKAHGTVPAHRTLVGQAFPDCTLESSSGYCSETESTHRHDFVWKRFTFRTQGFPWVTLLAGRKRGRVCIPQAWVSLAHANSSIVFHYKTNLFWTFKFNSLVLPWNEACVPPLLHGLFEVGLESCTWFICSNDRRALTN